MTMGAQYSLSLCVCVCGSRRALAHPLTQHSRAPARTRLRIATSALAWASTPTAPEGTISS